VTEHPDDRRRVSLNMVAPKYFEALATPLIAGRDFAFDDEGRPRVAIVIRRWRATTSGRAVPSDVISLLKGRRAPRDRRPGGRREVSRSARDTAAYGLYESVFRAAAAPTGRSCCAPRCRRGWWWPVRRAVRDMLPTVSVAKVTTFAEQVDGSILPERLTAMLSVLFGIVAAMLVANGPNPRRRDREACGGACRVICPRPPCDESRSDGRAPLRVASLTLLAVCMWWRGTESNCRHYGFQSKKRRQPGAAEDRCRCFYWSFCIPDTA
jgi:hypothetical protein